ncbi:MAG: wax ester/triacylglycerol synthase domain-containing protein, partial [Microthrixaceae bacterium]
MAGGEAHDARRMSDFESVMWELERDPRLSSAFANLTTFDRPPDRDRLRARMERASRRVPRLRQRVVPAPARLSTPEWREDPTFDLDHHLRWVDLGGAATERDLFELVAVIARQPFDRARPLWEFVVIEGLAGNRAAMVQRMHHTITDGEGGIRISVEFLDLERDPAPIPEPDTTVESPATDRSEDTTVDTPEPATDETAAAEPGPGCSDGSLLGRTAGAVGHGVREGLGQVARGAVTVGGLAVHPTEIPRRGADVAALARSTVRQARLDGRRSPLWTERSLDRWFATAALDLEEVRGAAHSLGVSINDLF